MSWQFLVSALRITRGCLKSADPSSSFTTSNSCPPLTQTCYIVDTCVQLVLQCEFAEAWPHMAAKREKERGPRKLKCTHRFISPSYILFTRTFCSTTSCKIMKLFLDFVFIHIAPSDKSQETVSSLALYNVLLCVCSNIWVRGLPQWRQYSLKDKGNFNVSRCIIAVLICLQRSLCQTSLPWRMQRGSIARLLVFVLVWFLSSVWNHYVSDGLVDAEPNLVEVMSLAPHRRKGAGQLIPSLQVCFAVFVHNREEPHH